MKVGIIGCGNISGIYLEKMKTFKILEVAGCADMIQERAEAQGSKYQIPAYDVSRMLAHPDIDIIVNLTTPDAHAPIAIQALEAGKSVYNEKPLAIALEEGNQILALAEKKGLRVGCAPDTFLGAGLQTCRHIIDAGTIGFPVAATAFMMCHGHENWHPSPEFFYKKGGGPMFDMGPYYLTALINLLGPVRRVMGVTRKTFSKRLITSTENFGKQIIVDVPTHIAGTLEFASGAVGTIIMSFDVWRHSLPKIEIYGSEATLRVPDPNGFGGPVELWRQDSKDWETIPLTHDYQENTRGIGVADMAQAIRSGRNHRASGKLANHVLDVMHAFHEASEIKKAIDIRTNLDRPEPIPVGLEPGILDE